MLKQFMEGVVMLWYSTYIIWVNLRIREEEAVEEEVP